eukprot:g25614.t1
MLSGLLQDTLPEMIPDTLDSALSASNSFLQKGIEQIVQEFQQSLAKVTVRHKRVIPVSAVSQKQVPGFGCGEGVAGGAFCKGLACLAGCAVTCLQFGRWLQRQFVPFVNDYNAQVLWFFSVLFFLFLLLCFETQAWEDATKEPTQVFARQHVQAKADNGRRMPFCVVAEVQDQCAQRLVVALGEHVCNEMPIVKLVGQRGFRRIWRWQLGRSIPKQIAITF